jgi:enamine deaminase RidA (YjgF/YER057c/UK114 family)
VNHLHSETRMSQVVVHSGTAFFAGQVADASSGGTKDQTRNVLAKFDGLLSEARSSEAHLVAGHNFSPGIPDFDAMNPVYDARIDPDGPLPARVEGRLGDPDLRIEITAAAVV